MSKIGKKLIIIPQGIEVKKTDRILEFKGKNAALSLDLLPDIEVKIEDGRLSFSAQKNTIQARSNWGTMRSLAQNAIIGVSDGFKKVLELRGVGYRASLKGDTLVLSVGFSHPVEFKPPAGIKLSVEKSNVIVSGADKALVGQAAAKIRAIKKPNPYLGSGIRYKDEVIKMKAGKKAAGTTGGPGAA